MEKILAKLENYVLYALVFLFPFTVIASSSSPYTVTKLTILTYGLLLYLVIFSLRVIVSGKLNFSASGYDLPVFIIALSYILSTIFRTPNKMEAILLPGTTTAIVGGILLYYALNQIKDRSQTHLVLTVSAFVYSLFVLSAYLGLMAKIPQLPAFMKVKTFTPEGGYLPTFIYLATILPITVASFLANKDIKFKAMTVFFGTVIIIGALIAFLQIIPGKQNAPRFPSTRVSWEIAMDSLKASPFFGVGPGNYLTSFNRFRPISFNNTDIWAIKYTTASNFYFTLLTETGLLGLAGISLLLFTFYKNAKKQIKELNLVNWGFAGSAPFLSFTLLALILFVYPASILLMVLMFIYLSLTSKTHHTSINLAMQHAKENEGEGQSSTSKLLAIIIFVPVIAVLSYGGYLGSRILLAEYHYKNSLDALLANDAQGTYDQMRQAILVNPRVDRYRQTFSRVNLILADATARKENLTETDRAQISQLIQQAISEGKASVALNPLRSGNWESLGRTYQSIIPLANGADAFAAQAYAQAVALDPINPNLRVSLGGVYFAAKNYEIAARVFELAVSSKADLPNGHFNLAYAYKEQGKIDPAIQQMSLVLGLVKPDSQDYAVAKKSLEDFQSQKKVTTVPQEATENLTPPAVPSPAIEPKVDLPEGSEPPEEVITPTPTTTVTPTIEE